MPSPMSKRLLLCLCFLVPIKLFAQYYQSGTESFGTSWRKISANGINLIFPSDAEIFASSYLNSLLVADSLTGADYGLGSTPIDVVLHNHSILANGMVVWAPKRMELITFPFDYDNSELWNNHLAIHEMRHVKQMYALRRNQYKRMSFLLGQQAVGIAAALAPPWFLEGDAVYSETKFSNSGRGRNAEFYQHYRAHYLSRDSYFEYDKWLNGSFKDYVPNHYAFGFQLVDYVNSNFGPSTWNNVLDFASKWPFTVRSFYFGTKHTLKLSPRRLTYKNFAHRDSVWTSSFDTSAIEYPVLSPKHKVYTSYSYSYKNSSGNIISYRTSLSQTPAFVLLSNGNEKVIVKPGSLIGNPYINDSLIVWSEYKSNIRWEQKSRGRVIKYNYKTRKKTVFKQKGIFYSPIFYKPAGRLVALSYTSSGTLSVVKLLSSGEVLTVYTFENRVNPQGIKTDGELLYVIATTPSGQQIMQIDNEGRASVVVPPSYTTMTSFCVSRGNLYFSATNEFCENIFCHNILSGNTIKIVNSKYGSRYPTVAADGSIIFSCYTVDGYYVANTKVEKIYPIDFKTIRPNISDEIGASESKVSRAGLTDTVYTSQKYSELKHLFNFHSWAPLFIKPLELVSGDYQFDFGATVMSQNLTGSTVFTAGYGYKPRADFNHLFNATVQYSGFWPKFYASFDLEPDNATLYKVKTDSLSVSKQRISFKISMSIPLYLTSGKIVTYIMPFSTLVHTNDYFSSLGQNAYEPGYISNDNGLYFSALSRMSHRDLRYKFGTTLRLSYVSSLGTGNNLGNLFAVVSRVYLPGFFSNHSIMLKSSYQHQNLRNFYLSNKIEFPRGYSRLPSENFFGVNFNYALPLCYPDYNFGMLVYVKRLSLNMFYDCAKNSYVYMKNGTLVNVSQNLSSYGLELTTNFNILRFSFPIELTCRLAWPNNGGDMVSWFGLSVAFN